MGRPNCYTLLDVRNGLVQSALSDAQCLGSDADTAAVQGGHCHVEALARLPSRFPSG